MILGIPWQVWLVVAAALLYIINRLEQQYRPMEPTEATVTRIIARYDSRTSFTGPFLIYVEANTADNIGFEGVVQRFKERFGDTVQWTDGDENPANWPVYIGRFSGRAYKKLNLTALRHVT